MKMNKLNLSVIVPMYNTQNISKNLKQYESAISKFDKNFEIIVVDDGSKNNYLKEAQSVQNKNIKVVGYKKNHGKGYAIKYGFKFCKGKYIGFLDSGAEFDAGNFKNFIEILEKNNADIIVGSKRHPNSEVDYPITRRIMSRGYQLMNKILFNLNVRDTQVGMKLFKRESLEKIMPKILVKKFAYDIEILALATRYHYKIFEAPIKLDYKFGSTIRIKSIISMILDTLAVFYRLKILHWYDKNEK
jgi:glycosyltransferase involved in cell wall biosynthesis